MAPIGPPSPLQTGDRCPSQPQHHEPEETIVNSRALFAEQYFASTTDRRAATAISIAPPQTISGIDEREKREVRRE
jgi:hypothetical protein